MTDQSEWLEKAMEHITSDEMEWFRHFYSCCEDGEGHTVPKDVMLRLAKIGLVRRVNPAGMHEVTELGSAALSLRAAPQDVAEPELVGWQFRYVFHKQDNRRSAWSGSVLPPPRTMQSGAQIFPSDNHHFEVRDVFGGPVGGGAPGLATPPDREAPAGDVAEPVVPVVKESLSTDVPRQALLLAKDARGLVQQLQDKGFVSALYNGDDFSRTDVGQWMQTAAQYLEALAAVAALEAK